MPGHTFRDVKWLIKATPFHTLDKTKKKIILGEICNLEQMSEVIKQRDVRKKGTQVALFNPENPSQTYYVLGTHLYPDGNGGHVEKITVVACDSPFIPAFANAHRESSSHTNEFVNPGGTTIINPGLEVIKPFSSAVSFIDEQELFAAEQDALDRMLALLKEAETKVNTLRTSLREAFHAMRMEWPTDRSGNKMRLWDL